MVCICGPADQLPKPHASCGISPTHPMDGAIGGGPGASFQLRLSTGGVHWLGGICWLGWLRWLGLHGLRRLTGGGLCVRGSGGGLNLLVDWQSLESPCLPISHTSFRELPDLAFHDHHCTLSLDIRMWHMDQRKGDKNVIVGGSSCHSMGDSVVHHGCESMDPCL